MITALNVEVAKKEGRFKSFISLFKRNKIKAELRQTEGISLLYITCITRNGKVSLNKLSGLIGAQRSRLLCSKEIKFPPESGFVRFNSNDFKIRLCTNMAYGILGNMENCNISVGIYDPQAICSDFLLNALEYSADVTVVTEEYKTYRCQLNRALDELGASAVITNRADALMNCRLIIAPTIINESLPVKNDTIILTIDKPRVQQGGLVYYNYQFKIPNNLQKLKPEAFDDEYFCSALYTLESMYDLGSIMPDLCYDNNCSQTIGSAVKQLNT